MSQLQWEFASRGVDSVSYWVDTEFGRFNIGAKRTDDGDFYIANIVDPTKEKPGSFAVLQIETIKGLGCFEKAKAVIEQRIADYRNRCDLIEWDYGTVDPPRQIGKVDGVDRVGCNFFEATDLQQPVEQSKSRMFVGSNIREAKKWCEDQLIGVVKYEDRNRIRWTVKSEEYRDIYETIDDYGQYGRFQIQIGFVNSSRELNTASLRSIVNGQEPKDQRIWKVLRKKQLNRPDFDVLRFLKLEAEALAAIPFSIIDALWFEATKAKTELYDVERRKDDRLDAMKKKANMANARADRAEALLKMALDDEVIKKLYRILSLTADAAAVTRAVLEKFSKP